MRGGVLSDFVPAIGARYWALYDLIEAASIYLFVLANAGGALLRQRRFSTNKNYNLIQYATFGDDVIRLFVLLAARAVMFDGLFGMGTEL